MPAPAKLNLFLHVTGRRADGYHTLESLFVALDSATRSTLDAARRRRDRAHQRRRRRRRRRTISPCARRARCKRATGVPLGVDIAVDKRIPLGGGLGGGSSDAASRAARAQPAVGSRPAARASSLRSALALGADVPFFLGGEPALARGIGERLTPVSLPPLLGRA